MVTDGTEVCAFCGEWKTGCGLCGSAPMRDMSNEIRKMEQDRIAGDAELAAQERAIRSAAEKRQGF